MLLPHVQNLFDMEISVLEFSCGQLESVMNKTCTLMWTYEEMFIYYLYKDEDVFIIELLE